MSGSEQIAGSKAAPTLSASLDRFRAGQPVILIDDPEAKNGANYVVAAEFCTVAHVMFMMGAAHGAIAVPLPESLADRLDLPLAAGPGSRRSGTAFSVSVEAASVTTGVAAEELARSIRALADPYTTSDDLRRPGHVHPIRARDGGLLVRPRYSEGCVDLCRIAGLQPVAATCRIVSSDGSFTRGADLDRFARQHDLPVITVEDLIRERLRTDRLVERAEEAHLPTPFGEFRIVGYQGVIDLEEHVALAMGDTASGGSVLTHVHRRCVLGDVFGSRDCDCQARLRRSMAAIAEQGRGVIVYLQDNARGLVAAHDTPEVDLFATDAVEDLDAVRIRSVTNQILNDLGVREALPVPPVGRRV